MPLLAHYKLNGDATDAGGDGHDGTPTDVSFAAGKIGQAAVFDGSTSVINLTAHGFQLAENTSFSVWIKPTVIIGNLTPGIFAGAATGGWNTNWIALQYVTGSGFCLSMRNNSAGQIGFGPFAHATGDWLCLAVTCETGWSYHCYADGVELALRYNYPVYDYISLSYFGRGYAGSTPISQGRWAGLADDLRIYNEVLPLWKIKAIYNFGKGSEECEPWQRLIRRTIQPTVQPLIGA